VGLASNVGSFMKYFQKRKDSRLENCCDFIFRTPLSVTTFCQ